MKKLLLGIGVIIFVMVGTVGSCAWGAFQFGQKFLANTLNLQSRDMQIVKWCGNGLPFVDQLERLLDHQTYLVVLQNNREIRPSGGFMGSYAKIKLAPSGLAEFSVQDIYVPDGQIVGHVDPPAPIQQAFGQGWWKLRDSNWDPDFTVAAPQMAWFFDQGKEPADGIIAVNLSLVNSLLGVLGEIDPVDYSEKVSAKTFYDLAQKYAEVGFFPGSTQKRDFLGAVGNALMRRIIISSAQEKLGMAKVIWQQLKGGEIIMWFKEPALQQVVGGRHWDGGLGNPTADYLYVVETNLGANKANCCISRQVTQEITDFQTKLTLNFRNENPFTNPKPPLFWGGNYLDYLRIIIPAPAQIQSVKVGDQLLAEKTLDNQVGVQEDRFQTENRPPFKIIGFWVPVPAGGQLTVEVQYSYGRRLGERLIVRKQPGIESFPYKLVVNGKEVTSDTIDRDKEYVWTK
ncbi:MAG: DUF4012 domain-containing protein [bacterium]|nr:DUF4012 domain-containing protein [bacterium]